ncbi:hypothetical protein C8R42DRAFT_728693 [Lentinula raphanica]|nr:hypothetical protein C8R42DRAFT_728693 [Lentinula raphanica]
MGVHDDGGTENLPCWATLRITPRIIIILVPSISARSKARRGESVNNTTHTTRTTTGPSNLTSFRPGLTSTSTSFARTKTKGTWQQKKKKKKRVVGSPRHRGVVLRDQITILGCYPSKSVDRTNMHTTLGVILVENLRISEIPHQQSVAHSFPEEILNF